MGIDPKMLSDPNLMAMYSMGMMPPMSQPSPMTNGNTSGTPLPSSKGGNTAKPKPGTVAAALQKKKERLMKENENEHHMDEGLNLSVCKPNGNGSEHPTKLEALLAKPIEDLPPPHPLDVASLSTNGEPPRTEGV